MISYKPNRNFFSSDAKLLISYQENIFATARVFTS